MDINVGAWGWKHVSWEQDVFYPDDLPADWRLAYYSNEFDLVVIPASYWDETEEENWLDDVEDDFVFFIDWPVTGSEEIINRCRTFIDQAGRQIGSILLDNQLLSDQSQNQLKWLTELSVQTTVRQYGMHQTVIDFPFLQDDTDTDAILTGDSLMAIHSDDGESLRDLSKRLQQLLAGKNIQQIILAGDEPSINRLNELKTMLPLF